GGHVPEAHAPVAPGRRQQLAVLAERDAQRRPGVALEVLQDFAGARADGAFDARRQAGPRRRAGGAAGERLAVGAEYEVGAALVGGRVEERDGQPDLAARHGVDAHRAVVADRADQLAVGRKRHALHLELVPVELEHLLAGLDLPEPNRLVVAAGGERLAV